MVKHPALAAQAEVGFPRERDVIAGVARGMRPDRPPPARRDKKGGHVHESHSNPIHRWS